MENQKAAGVFATVSILVDRVSDNPAARIAAQEIAERVRLAAHALAVSAVPPIALLRLGSSRLPLTVARPRYNILRTEANSNSFCLTFDHLALVWQIRSADFVNQAEPVGFVWSKPIVGTL